MECVKLDHTEESEFAVFISTWSIVKI